MAYITLKQLDELLACSAARAWFQNRFRTQASVTRVLNAAIVIDRMDWVQWYIVRNVDRSLAAAVMKLFSKQAIEYLDLLFGEDKSQLKLSQELISGIFDGTKDLYILFNRKRYAPLREHWEFMQLNRYCGDAKSCMSSREYGDVVYNYMNFLGVLENARWMADPNSSRHKEMRAFIQLFNSSLDKARKKKAVAKKKRKTHE